MRLTVAVPLFVVACGPLITDRTDDEGMTALMRASLLADTAAVAALLERTADVDVAVPSMEVTGIVNTITGVRTHPRTTVGYTALTFAARHRRVANARLLIANGADVNRVARGGDTPLSLAIAKNDAEMTRVLMKAGARPDPRVLGAAVSRAAAGTIEALLQNGANPNASAAPHAGSRPDEFIPLLIIAMKRGDPAVVRILLAAGARADVRDGLGWSALRWAHLAKSRKTSGATEIVALLDSVGASDVAGIRSNDLMNAVLANDLAAVRMALRGGADPSASDAQGVPALVHASARGHSAMARALLEAGAKVDVKGPFSATPLTAAIENGDAELAKTLLDAGARGDAMDSRGVVPLMVTAQRTLPEIAKLILADTSIRVPHAALQHAVSRADTMQVRMFLERGADPNGNRGFIIYTAARGCGNRDNVSVIRMLLDRGADPNKWPWRPALMAAAGRCGPDAVQVLLQHGAEVNRKDWDGVTALMAAANGGRIENVRLLLAAGAKVNMRDVGGFTALSHARSAVVRQELLKAGARGDTTELPPGISY